MFRIALSWSSSGRHENKQSAYKHCRLIACHTKPSIQIEVRQWIEVVKHVVIKLVVVDLNRSESVYASNHFAGG